MAYRRTFLQSLSLAAPLSLVGCVSRTSVPDTDTSSDTLLPADAGVGDDVGFAVDCDGRMAVVGAPAESETEPNPGRVYLFERVDGSWTEREQFESRSDRAAFGWSVAITGDTVAIGAPKAATVGHQAGAVDLFERTEAGWRRTRITPTDASEGDRFGWSLALEGDRLLVSADAAEDARGAAYVFEREGDRWAERTRLMGATPGDFFGTDVDIDGASALVGAVYEDTTGEKAGAAYLFERAGGEWTEQACLIANDAAAHDHFGGAVALSDDIAAVGAPTSDTDVEDAGAVYVFERQGSSWTELARLTASDGSANDGFGWAVALDGDRLLGAADFESSQGTYAGAVYAFDRTDEGWTEAEKLTAPDAAAGDGFGESVAFCGESVLVGAPDDDNERGESAGAAYVLE